MAVVIQDLVGDEVNGRFYPTISGAARSRNHYPVEPILAEDGIRDVERSRGLGDVYKRQGHGWP